MITAASRRRRAAIAHDVAWLAERHGFPGLTAAGKVEATRKVDGETTTAIRYYISSKSLSAARVLDVVRANQDKGSTRGKIKRAAVRFYLSCWPRPNAVALAHGINLSPLHDCQLSALMR